MRALAIGFRLHGFDEVATQKLLALIERNLQRNGDLRLSLMVSVSFLGRAAEVDAELLKRLRRLAQSGRAEMVAMPAYNSLAFNYDREEWAEQIRLERESLREKLGVEAKVLAGPELTYTDEMGAWAENEGFLGMIGGRAGTMLKWRSPNHVYEAYGCRFLRLLCRNEWLSEMGGDGAASDAEQRTAGAGRLSSGQWLKRLEMEGLRGEVVNLWFEPEVLTEERGAVAVLDDLLAKWTEREGRKFVTVSEALRLATPQATLSAAEAKGLLGDGEVPAGAADAARDGAMAASAGVVDAARAEKLQRRLYDLKKDVAALGLLTEWRKLTDVRWREGLEEALAELERKVEAQKLVQEQEKAEQKVIVTVKKKPKVRKIVVEETEEVAVKVVRKPKVRKIEVSWD